MIITLTGRPCAGKSSAAKFIIQKYGFKLVDMGKMFDDEAEKRGLSRAEFSQLRVKDPSIDFEFDKRIPLTAKQYANENLLYDSRVAHHFLPDAFKVYVTVDKKEMAKRLVNSDRTGKEKYTSVEDALAALTDRMKTERTRYKNIYNFDLEDMSNYDLVVNTKKLTPEQAADIIYNACVEYYKQKKQAKKFIKEAIAEAEKGIANGDGGPFGCVVVKDGKIIGRGHNTVVCNQDCTCHGEMEAIRAACANLKSFNLAGADLYTTGMPCPMCLGAIQWANIEHLFYGCSLEENSKVGFRDSLFAQGIPFKKENLGFKIIQVEHDACWKVLEKYHKMKNKQIY